MSNRLYRALKSLYWSTKRGGKGLSKPACQAGEVRDDIPAESVKWLLRKGWIEPVPDSGQEPVREGGD